MVQVAVWRGSGVVEQWSGGVVERRSSPGSYDPLTSLWRNLGTVGIFGRHDWGEATGRRGDGVTG